MSDALAEIKPYVEAFKKRGDVPGEPGWLAKRREAAMQRFAELGFPSRRLEAWRFTNLSSLQKSAFSPAADSAVVEASALAPWRYPGEAHRLALIDGRFSPKLSSIGVLPKGVYLASTARTLKDRPELLEAAFRETETVGGQPSAGEDRPVAAGREEHLDPFVARLDRRDGHLGWQVGDAEQLLAAARIRALRAGAVVAQPERRVAVSVKVQDSHFSVWYDPGHPVNFLLGLDGRVVAVSGPDEAGGTAAQPSASCVR